jgi:excinuclease ABC subunit C
MAFEIKLEIESILKKLPDAPGVYLMKDAHDRIIYIGKSKSLKSRVTSYFRGFNSHTPKTQTLVVNISDIEYIITDNEEEALALEANLIKKNKPKFNVMLKDDKQYPYITVTLSEDFPRIIKTREVKNDGNRYFGPYSSNYAVNQTLETIHKIFPVRKCNRDLSRVKRPCLNYHIKRCSGPCVYANKVRADYQEDIESIIEFLKGHQKTLLKTLNEQMSVASEKLDFEKAIDLRDRIEAIRFLQTEQKVVSTKAINQDIIGTYVNDEEFCITVFFVREGKMIDRQNFIFDLMTDFDYSEMIRTFMTQFYTDTSFIPKEILVEQVMDDQDSLENYLSLLAEKKIRVVTPQRGNKIKLVKMVNLNAKEYLEKHKARFNQQKEKYQSIIGELNALIGLGEIHRIEAYDISNIYGVFNVGTMVVYEDGKKKKNDYRKFKIRSVKKSDDYASMREVMDRRFARLVDEFDEASFSKWPNLILLDGGKGQVSTVTEVMESYGLEIPVIGMVKDDHHRTRGLVKGKDIYELKADSQLYKFIYEIQEEVHRFAIDYHRTLRTKSVTGSILDDIPGVGKKRREDLLKHFSNITRIQNATIDELTEIPSINEKTANVIKQHLKVSKK